MRRALAFAVAWSMAAAPVAGLGAREVRLERYSFASLKMGTRFNLVLYAPSPAAAGRASRKALDRIAALDSVFSDYRAESELRTLEAVAFPSPARVSSDLLAILQFSLRLARLTEGAFDPTIGSVTRLWRRAAETGKLPSPRQIERARRGGHRFLELDRDASTVRFLRPGIQLDLGGVAKGYAADQALAVLWNEGIRSALVDAGGDIAVSEAPPGEKGWLVELEPLEEGGPRFRLLLENEAIATSGTSARGVLVEGVRRSHLFDPDSGRSLEGRLLSTVLAPDGATADALATAFSVMPPARALALAARLGVCVRLVRTEHGQPVDRANDCFRSRVSDAPAG